MDRDFLAAQGRADDALKRRRRAEEAIAREIERLEARRERHAEVLDGVHLGSEPSLPAETIVGLDRRGLEALCVREERRIAALESRLAQLAHIGETLDAIEQGKTPRKRLGTPPRRVPDTYVVAEAATWWIVASTLPVVLALMAERDSNVGAACGGAVVSLVLHAFRVRTFDYRFIPMAFPALFGGVVAAFLFVGLEADTLLWPTVLPAVVILMAIRRALTRRRFLERCVDADEVTVISTGTWSSGKNWPYLYGQGWDAEVKGFTGESQRTRLKWRVGSMEGEARYTGPPWNGGIVLVDPETRLPVLLSELGCGPRPDLAGEWDPVLQKKVRWRCIAVCTSIVVWVLAIALYAA